MFTSVSIVILCYLLLVVFIFFYQRNLLYHPFENNYTSEEANFSYEEIFVPTSNGSKLKAWFHKKDLKQKKTLVFFHGNAGNLSNRIYKLNLISKSNQAQRNIELSNNQLEKISMLKVNKSYSTMDLRR